MTPFQHLRIQRAGQLATLWLDVAGQSHNVLGHAVLAELDAAMTQIEAERGLRLVVVRSAKPAGFAAGADLREFPELREPAAAQAFCDEGHRVFDRLARLPITTVAVIHSVCLGGGLELALACDYRIAAGETRATIGLPEVELGLIPGWGGLQRLPRVVGWIAALEMILGAKRLSAEQARKRGLVNAIVRDESEIPAAIERFVGRSKRTGRIGGRPFEKIAPARWFIFRHAEMTLRRRAPDDMPAPFEALRVLREDARHGRNASEVAERQSIGQLATSSACRNLMELFLRHEAARKTPAESAQPVRRVGVVGAGTMGAGIIQLALIKGFSVTVQQRSAESLAAGKKRVAELLGKAADLNLLSSEQARRHLDSVTWTTNWEGFGAADLVVESIAEDVVTKREIFRSIEQHVRPNVPIATNTSSLCVEWIQEGLQHPERVVGLHFFHPVHRIPLVEVIRPAAAAESAIATARQWAVDLGKTPVTVGDSQGFVVNRILMPYVNEALLLLGEGLPVKRIDAVMRRFGMPLGPLELLDRGGIDVVAKMAEAMKSQMGERFAPNPIFDRMCEHGWLGTKSGIGFYQYRGKSARPNPKLHEVEPGVQRTFGQVEREARDRMVLLMINEAVSCLARGLVERPELIDLAMVLGTGWAPHRGGPLRYADEIGVANVVAKMEEFHRRFGPRFEPHPELKRRASAGVFLRPT
jgi:3-hydroxyacyl-CoA dehydrogenase/enoyl-CoA hydratase/3-hydroxybutyryl-CoA epimerase